MSKIIEIQNLLKKHNQNWFIIGTYSEKTIDFIHEILFVDTYHDLSHDPLWLRYYGIRCEIYTNEYYLKGVELKDTISMIRLAIIFVTQDEFEIANQYFEMAFGDDLIRIKNGPEFDAQSVYEYARISNELGMHDKAKIYFDICFFDKQISLINLDIYEEHANYLYQDKQLDEAYLYYMRAIVIAEERRNYDLMFKYLEVAKKINNDAIIDKYYKIGANYGNISCMAKLAERLKDKVESDKLIAQIHKIVIPIKLVEVIQPNTIPADSYVLSYPRYGSPEYYFYDGTINKYKKITDSERQTKYNLYRIVDCKREELSAMRDKVRLDD